MGLCARIAAWALFSACPKNGSFEPKIGPPPSSPLHFKVNATSGLLRKYTIYEEGYHRTTLKYHNPIYKKKHFNIVPILRKVLFHLSVSQRLKKMEERNRGKQPSETITLNSISIFEERLRINQPTENHNLGFSVLLQKLSQKKGNSGL